MQKLIKCVLACTNAGEPDFAFVIIRCSLMDIELGCHYNEAEKWAEDNGYERPFITWDERECPDWLLERFIWETASIIPITVTS